MKTTDNVYLNMAVTNTGTRELNQNENFTVTYSITKDGVFFKSGDETFGGFTREQYQYCNPNISLGKLETGNYRVTVTLNSGSGTSKIPELSYSNNTEYYSFLVKEEVVALPDLTYTNVIVNNSGTKTSSFLKKGETVNASVTVKNQGDGSTGRNFTVEFVLKDLLTNKTYTQESTVNTLAAGATSTASVSFPKTANFPLIQGNYQISIYVDSGLDITESNESNNRTNYSFSILQMTGTIAAGAEETTKAFSLASFFNNEATADWSFNSFNGDISGAVSGVTLKRGSSLVADLSQGAKTLSNTSSSGYCLEFALNPNTTAHSRFFTYRFTVDGQIFDLTLEQAAGFNPQTDDDPYEPSSKDTPYDLGTLTNSKT